MNTIEIHVSETPNAPDATDERGCIELQLRVNGIEITDFDGEGIEPCALAAAATQTGEFYIATCGCGEPQCAGIYRGVRVNQSAGIISWEIPVPYVTNKGSNRSQSGVMKYEFSTDNYQAEIAKMVDTLRSLQAREAQGERFSLHGYPGTLVEQIVGWIDAGIVPF